MLVKMNCANAAGGGVLTYADYSADYTNTNSVTIPNDYDVVVIVTSFSSVGGGDSYKPSYDGVTYEWRYGNITASANKGVAAIIPNVKANTNITFANNLWFSLYGYNLV